jgi:hypothetical protein
MVRKNGGIEEEAVITSLNEKTFRHTSQKQLACAGGSLGL